MPMRADGGRDGVVSPGGVRLLVGFYRRHIFPRLMELALGSESCTAERRRALAAARGDVLEIGFGTGLNLAYYPPTVAGLTSLDPVDPLPARVAARIAAATFPVTQAKLDAEPLPFAGERFDTVVSSGTLCAIPDAVAALRECGACSSPRELSLPGARPRATNAVWPAGKIAGTQSSKIVQCGCNVNRPIDRLIAEAGLVVAESGALRAARRPPHHGPRCTAARRRAGPDPRSDFSAGCAAARACCRPAADRSVRGSSCRGAPPVPPRRSPPRGASRTITSAIRTEGERHTPTPHDAVRGRRHDGGALRMSRPRGASPRRATARRRWHRRPGSGPAAR